MHQPCHHRVLSADPSREQRHSLVLGAAAAEHVDLDVATRPELHELWKDPRAVKRGVRAEVAGRSIILDETHKPHVFDSAPLIFGERKDNDFRHIRAQRCLKPVIRPGQREDGVV